MAPVSLQGKAKFPQPSAPKGGPADGGAQLGAAAEIECRDAAPQAAADARPAQSSSAVPVHRRGPEEAASGAADSEPPKAAGSEDALTGRQHGAAAMLLGTGSGLSNLWDKHWSHTDITRPPDHSKHAHQRNRRSLDKSSLVASASDAGHLNTVSQQSRLDATDVHVVLHLLSVEDAPDGGTTQQPGNVRVRLEVKAPDSAAETRSPGAGPGEPSFPSKAVGFAPVARLATFGGFIRSQSWRGAAQTSEPASMADSSPGLPVTGDMQSSAAAQPRGSGAVGADSSSTSVPCPVSDATSQRGSTDEGMISVNIEVGGQAQGNENSGHPCRLVISMPSKDGHSHAAADPPSSQRGSRLNSLSGLFRASKPPQDGALPKPKESSQADTSTSGDNVRPRQASIPSLSMPEQQQTKAPASSAGPGQKRARWAVPGSAAVSSLYGLVQHAAEVPLAHAGRAVGSLPGMRSHAAAQPTSNDREADANMTAEIVMKIRTAASAVLEVPSLWPVPQQLGACYLARFWHIVTQSTSLAHKSSPLT